MKLLILAALSCAAAFCQSALSFSSEALAFSATPTFSVLTAQSAITLTASITGFTIQAGFNQQQKMLQFCQNGTGGFTVAAPSNVTGFIAINATANACTSETFQYSTGSAAWQSLNLQASNLSGCGTGAAIGAGSSRSAGYVTLGSSPGATCTITWPVAYIAAPSAQLVTASNGSVTYPNTVSLTTLAVSLGTAGAGGAIHWLNIGGQ